MNCVSNYMFRFRRSDAYKRNEWSNYTNWEYENVLPQQLSQNFPGGFPAGVKASNLWLTGNTNQGNERLILRNMGILCDGKYRENVLVSGYYNYIEKFYYCNGDMKDGLYIYSFSLDTDSQVYQPSGAMNMSKFKDITFEINTIQPPPNPNASFDVICDIDGNVIGTRKDNYDINLYNYDFKVFEERYNILEFVAGNAGLMYAR